MKNLAGHPVSIFLFRFVLRKNAISYVVNESIAEDMYPNIAKKIEPLVHACSETLLRYRQYCRSDTIMDGNILTDGCFEVMLSQGLGSYLMAQEKQNLFNDARAITELLEEVMDRRTKEMERGSYPGPQLTERKIGPAGGTHSGYEALGEEQLRIDEMFCSDEVSPELKKRRLKPTDLPAGVGAKASYDHRGKCIAFEHDALGGLGKIVLVAAGPDQTLMEAELFKEKRANLAERKLVFERVVEIVAARMGTKRTVG